jgi:hypothetical protein
LNLQSCFNLPTAEIYRCELSHLGYFFVELEFELRASHLQQRYSTTYATFPVHFGLVILEMGSHKLFAKAGLELQSSPFQSRK